MPGSSGFDAPDAEPEYGLLAGWTDGNVLLYEARRPVVVSNFGDDLGPANVELTNAYYRADEPRAVEILGSLRVRYVLTHPYDLPFGPRSMLARLHVLDGVRSPVSVACELPPGGALCRPVREAVPALRRHRLVYESGSLSGVLGHTPMFKVWEYVEGARLEGQTKPGSAVIARLRAVTNRGRVFEYVAQTRAQPDGTFRLVVPYATSDGPPSVRTGSHYAVRGEAGWSARVEVGERSVREGLTVPIDTRSGKPGG